MKLVNLTPHTIVIKSDTMNGERTTTLEPSGTVARIEMEYKEAEDIWHDTGKSSAMMSDSNPLYGGISNEIFTVRQTPGEIIGLPEPRDGEIFVVSAMVAAAVKRFDVVAPDTGPTAIRIEEGDRKGQVEAVTRLIRFDEPAPWQDDIAYVENPDEAF